MTDLTKLQEEFLIPSDQLVTDLSGLQGDLIILGAGGKMGPDLSMMAKKALINSGKKNRVIAVSRFSEKKVQNRLNQTGVETVSMDLLEFEYLDQYRQLIPKWVNNCTLTY